MSNSVSVVIFCRDNEKTIEMVLKSVQPFADEILYMDTGSKDRTLDIARQYTKRIYIVENMLYRNNANFRNFLNSEAVSKWTLFLDTDEVVTKNMATNIKDKLSELSNSPSIHHIYYKLLTLVRDNKHTLTTFGNHPYLSHPRIALREYAKWVNPRHEIYIGEGECYHWDIFGAVHYNLMDINSLRDKLLNTSGLYGEYGDCYDINMSDEEVLNKFIGKSDIGEIPEGVEW